MLPLPIPDDKGRRVILLRTGGYDTREVKVVDIFKVQMMISDIMLEEDDRETVAGIVNVVDHSKTTLAHMALFSPSLVKKVTTLFQVNILTIAETTEPPLLSNFKMDLKEICYEDVDWIHLA
jgi:hypothetical protein